MSKIKQDFAYRDGDIVVQKNQGSVDASKFALISHFDEGCLRFFQIRAAELKNSLTPERARHVNKKEKERRRVLRKISMVAPSMQHCQLNSFLSTKKGGSLKNKYIKLDNVEIY